MHSTFHEMIFIQVNAVCTVLSVMFSSVERSLPEVLHANSEEIEST